MNLVPIKRKKFLIQKKYQIEKKNIMINYVIFFQNKTLIYIPVIRSMENKGIK